MKQPKRKKIKKHFSNALTVLCLADGKEYNKKDYPFLLKGNATYEDGSFLYSKHEDLESACKENEYFIAWTKDDKYAKILTYKEKTFSITESQINKLEKDIKNGYCNDAIYYLKKLFPEAFEKCFFIFFLFGCFIFVLFKC